MRSISLCFSRLWSIFGYRNDADRRIAVLRVGSKGCQSHSVRCVGLVPRLLHRYLLDATLCSAEAPAVLSSALGCPRTELMWTNRLWFVLITVETKVISLIEEF